MFVLLFSFVFFSKSDHFIENCTFQRESYDSLLVSDEYADEPETQVIYLPAAWSGSFFDYIDGQIQQTARYKEETLSVEFGYNSPELPNCSQTSRQVQSSFI